MEPNRDSSVPEHLHLTVGDRVAARWHQERQGVEFFVLVAGLKTEPGNELSLAAATSARQAHDFAAADFRKKRGLASSTHVETRTLHRTPNEAEATLFLVRLVAKMDAKTAETNGSSTT